MIEMKIDKSKGYGKLQAGKQSKTKRVHVKMHSADPKLVCAMSKLIEASTK